jgi:adenylate kinase
MNGIVLMGMPGAGKGTIGQYICSKYGYKHICSGDLLRDEIRDKTVIGLEIESTIAQGKQVADSLITAMVLDKLEQLTKNNQSFVLDGFPQTSQQLSDLKQFELKQTGLSLRYVSVVVDKNTALERMSNRLSCSICHMIYSKIFFTEKQDRTCCAKPLEFRPSDQEERAKKRVETFLMTTDKLLQNELKDAYVIDGNLEVDTIKKSVSSYLEIQNDS